MTDFLDRIADLRFVIAPQVLYFLKYHAVFDANVEEIRIRIYGSDCMVEQVRYFLAKNPPEKRMRVFCDTETLAVKEGVEEEEGGVKFVPFEMGQSEVFIMQVEKFITRSDTWFQGVNGCKKGGLVMLFSQDNLDLHSFFAAMCPMRNLLMLGVEVMSFGIWYVFEKC